MYVLGRGMVSEISEIFHNDKTINLLGRHNNPKWLFNNRLSKCNEAKTDRTKGVHCSTILK